MLGHRLRIIGGDSHWREVMHFLFSALVENDRVTDLAVATGVLAEINEGIESSEERAFHRRMSLGAAIAARLLGEAVLEQDMNVRYQFRKCLEPILGTMSTEFVTLLSEPAGDDSSLWLYDMIIDSLKERTESENFAGATALLRSLPSDHVRIDEVKDLISNSSMAFRKVVFALLSRTRRRSDRPCPAWAYQVALATVLDQDWLELGAEGLEALTHLFGSDKDLFRVALADFGIHSNSAAILIDLFGEDNHEDQVTAFEEKRGVLLVKFSCLPERLKLENLPPAFIAELDRTGGLFGLIARILVYANSGTEEARIQVSESLDGRQDILGGLPSAISRYSPGPAGRDWRRPVGELIGSRASLPARFFASLTLDFEDVSPEDWEVTVESFPVFALGTFTQPELFVPPSQREHAAFLKKPEYCNRLIDVLLRDPRSLFLFAPIWGKFIEICPERDEEFRQGLVKQCSIELASQIFWFNADIHLIKLCLPSDAPLLPTVVRILVDYSHHQKIQAGDLTGVTQHVRDKLREMLSDSSLILDLIEREDTVSSVRAAAAMLYLLYPGGTADGIRRSENLIVSLYNPGEYSWYLKAAAGVLDERVTVGEPAAIRVIAKLLAKGHSDYMARLELEPILESWRQRSRAPVSTAQKHETWLDA